MSSAVFVDKKAAEEYLCPICLDVMTHPVQVECRGGHLFCKQCVDKLIESTPSQRLKCPICGTKFDRNSRSNPIQYIQRKINDLTVKCPHSDKTDKNTVNDNNNNNNNNSSSSRNIRRSKRLQQKQEKVSGKKRKRPDDESGDDEENEDDDIIILNTGNPAKRRKIDNIDYCDWNGRYGDFNKHINQCPFELVLCCYSHKGCKEKIRRKDRMKHLCQCSYAPMTCPQCNGMIIIFYCVLEYHLSNQCEMKMTKCYQCGDEMIQKYVSSHIEDECEETLIECKYKKYGCINNGDMIKRKDIKKHNKEWMERHLELIENSYIEIEERWNKRESKLIELKNRMAQMERDEISSSSDSSLDESSSSSLDQSSSSSSDESSSSSDELSSSSDESSVSSSSGY